MGIYSDVKNSKLAQSDPTRSQISHLVIFTLSRIPHSVRQSGQSSFER